jgi:hypothetical protein
MMFTEMAIRLILACLTDDAQEREFRIEQVRLESGLDRLRFSLALTTAQEAADWWQNTPRNPNGREYARTMLTDKLADADGGRVFA